MGSRAKKEKLKRIAAGAIAIFLAVIMVASVIISALL